MLLKNIAKQLLFPSMIPKLHAILQLVSAPLNATEVSIRKIRILISVINHTQKMND